MYVSYFVGQLLAIENKFPFCFTAKKKSKVMRFFEGYCTQKVITLHLARVLSLLKVTISLITYDTWQLASLTKHEQIC